MTTVIVLAEAALAHAMTEVRDGRDRTAGAVVSVATESGNNLRALAIAQARVAAGNATAVDLTVPISRVQDLLAAADCFVRHGDPALLDQAFRDALVDLNALTESSDDGLDG